MPNRVCSPMLSSRATSSRSQSSDQRADFGRTDIFRVVSARRRSNFFAKAILDSVASNGRGDHCRQRVVVSGYAVTSRNPDLPHPVVSDIACFRQ